jgi:hypothetical protein
MYSAFASALAGMDVQANQSSLLRAGQTKAASSSFPSANAYKFIFLTTAMLSAASIGLALFLRAKAKNVYTKLVLNDYICSQKSSWQLL